MTIFGKPRTKTCRQCQSDKPLAEFYAYSTGKYGVMARCKECHCANSTAHHALNREVRRARHFAKKYGLSIAEYERLASEQAGACLICLATPDGRLHVDHDHGTGEVRGLLCGPCNTAIGLLGDDASRMERAAQYVSASPPVIASVDYCVGAAWGRANRQKTQCPKGHPYSKENTAIWGGRRHCRACDRERRLQ